MTRRPLLLPRRISLSVDMPAVSPEHVHGEKGGAPRLSVARPGFPSQGEINAALAAAMRREWGGSAGTTKTIARAVGAPVRTVEDWLAEISAPRAEYLARLCAVSDEVATTWLRLTGRDDLAARAEAATVLGRIKRLLGEAS